MSETLTIDFRQPVPLFPLPNCVLLPHATIPLHIFETRYRRMTNDVLDGAGLIALASFEGDDWRESYEANPPVRPVVCVGHVIKHERLPDGRYNILLYGVCRARIREEVNSNPYRRAMLEPTEPGEIMEIDLADTRRLLEKLLKDPILRELASVSAVHNWLSNEIPTRALIDLTIMTVCDDVEQRYSMLAEPNVDARVRWLTGQLRGLHRTLSAAKRFEPPDLQDEIHLN